MAIIKYKKGNSWVSIPIYVNTGGEVLDYVSKTELESMGYISELKTINNLSLIGSGNINIAVDLSNYYTKTEVNGLIPSLNNYYKKSETYSQSEVDALIDSVNAGDVDLSNYYTKSQVDELIPEDYLTSSSLSEYATQTWVNNKNYAKAADIPTLMSELDNDSGYLTSIPSEYITESELSSTLSNYAKTSDIPTDFPEDAIRINYSDIEDYCATEITSDGTLHFYFSDSSSYSSVISNAVTSTKQTIVVSTTPNTFDRVYLDIVIHPTSNFYNYYYTCEINGIIGVGTSVFKIHGRARTLPPGSSMVGTEFFISKDCYSPVDIHYLTYSELKELADNYGLVPGRKYGITNYSCVYTLPVSEIEMEVSANDIECIICTAATENSLLETVGIVRSEGYVPIVECKYSIDPERVKWTSGMTSKSPKGVIWYMKDANGNECNYDFKHVKFRRWAITDITPNDTLDTGSGNPGAYAYCVTDTSYKWSDNRMRIGSGEATDETIVLNIFAGTWARCISELTTTQFATIPDTFHSEYALYGHKPYQITSDLYIKYLAWTNDMTSNIGVNSPRSIGSASVYGNQKVTVSTSSYIDCYTFDYQGTDASERTKYNSEDPLIESVIIGTKKPVLSNTCFIFTKDIMNSINTYLRNIYIPYCLHNTFLLRGFPGDGLYGNIVSLICNDLFLHNLIITHMFLHVHFNKLVGYNYLCADFLHADFGLFMRLTMFGFYQGIHTAAIDKGNLWYSSFSRVRYSSGSSWVAPEEGMYTYDVVSDDFCAANIMGPLQYAYFAPHFNRNTFRSFYNKGCRFGSNNQYCSLGECSYSNINYGGLGHFIKFGKIFRSTIPQASFSEKHYVTTSTGVETWPSTVATVPDLYLTVISSYVANVTNIHNYTGNVDISANIYNIPKKVLYCVNNVWGATYEHGLESIVASTAVTANLEEEEMLLNRDMPIEEPPA